MVNGVQTNNENYTKTKANEEVHEKKTVMKTRQKEMEHLEIEKSKKAEKSTKVQKEIQKTNVEKKEYWKKEENRIRKLKEAINQANQETKLKQTACEFSYDDNTNRIAIKVKDRETDEVIREIPAEETLEMLARIKEQAGLMMDERR